MTEIIKNNCDFDFYFNKTDVTPTILEGGDENSIGKLAKRQTYYLQYQ